MTTEIGFKIHAKLGSLDKIEGVDGACLGDQMRDLFTDLIEQNDPVQRQLKLIRYSQNLLESRSSSPEPFIVSDEFVSDLDRYIQKTHYANLKHFTVGFVGLLIESQQLEDDKPRNLKITESARGKLVELSRELVATTNSTNIANREFALLSASTIIGCYGDMEDVPHFANLVMNITETGEVVQIGGRYHGLNSKVREVSNYLTQSQIA